MDTLSKKVISQDKRGYGIKIGNFNCIKFPDNSVQIIFDKSVRNVKFGRSTDGEILAQLNNGKVYMALPNGQLKEVTMKK